MPKHKEVYSVQQDDTTLKMYFDPDTEGYYFQVVGDGDILYTGESYDQAKTIYEHERQPRPI
jgi:hypothetical protein